MRRRSKPDYGYINQYTSENYDRITILVPKGGKDRIKAEAISSGQTMNEFIVSRLPAELVGIWKTKGDDFSTNEKPM